MKPQINLKASINFPLKQSDRIYQNYLYYLILSITLLFALFIRLYLIDFESLDFQGFLDPWYNFIQENGRFWSLKHAFSNYNPTYLYLLIIINYLFPTLSSLHAVKLISITFDFIAAFLVYKIVEVKYVDSRLPAIAAIVFLLIPTVIINSSQWGQADGIYTTNLLASLYFILIKKNLFSLIFFGIAFSIKQQALFFAPVILISLLKGIIKWKSILIIPCVYIALLIPAWIAGRPLQDLLAIYLKQAGTYDDLTKSAPNIYQWVPGEFYNIAVPTGIIFTLVMISLFVFRIYRSNSLLNPDLLIQIALLSCLLMPYCLPKMHERYFYPADIFSTIFFFYFPKYWYIPILIIYSSLFSYMIFLLDKRMVSMQVLSLVMTSLIIFLLRELDKSLSTHQK